MFKKNILITGGSGFLGRNIAKFYNNNKYQIILASRNNALNRIAEEYSNCSFVPLDVSNLTTVDEVFKELKPSIVIHAAATKYVDLSIKFPNECVDVNILGSQNIARASIKHNVKTVIGISTDKATPPAKTIYGLSKSLMEHLFINLNKTSTTNFFCLRFGNIAWSSGSVLPIWHRMLKNKGIITSTGPEMKRYFFTVQEASSFVIRSLNHINMFKGKIVCCEMKQSKVLNLLEVFCKINNCKWKKGKKRFGDYEHEVLISKHEIDKTSIIKLRGRTYYLIDNFAKNLKFIKNEISTKNSNKLDKNDIFNIISNKPDDIF